MKYDFESIIERRGNDALAVDGLGTRPGFSPLPPKEGFDLIPMWIADMNFPVLPAIQEALIRRIEHPCFGYFDPRDEYFDSIIDWQSRRNSVTELLKEHIGYENGVLGGVASAVYAFSSTGDPILIHSPTYTGFTGTVASTGRRLVHSPLKRDAEGIWRMDYEDMEKKLSENNIHLAIFCSPHNPCGRVWERWEIERAMELYKKYDCIVISDEIWSDIIMPGYKHIPTQSVSEDARLRTLAMYAPSKTFSLAGLVGSYHIVYNKRLCDRLLSQSASSHYNSINLLSMYALIGAFGEEGHIWADELCQTIDDNIDCICSYISKHFEGVSFMRPQATYMLFVDCTQWCEAHGESFDELLKRGWEVGVAWQDGRAFHGNNCLRINLALPKSRLMEALDRMSKYVFI